MVFTVSTRSVTRVLACMVMGLSLASVAAQVALSFITPGTYRGLAELLGKFLLDSELNLPAWYASASLLVCAILLGIIACRERETTSPFYLHWFALAVIFLLMSIDEMTAVHEMFIVPIRRRLNAHGFFYYGWVIPGLLFVVIVAIAYLRFLFRHLDARSRRLFLAAGTIYVAGALGMEIAEGPIDNLFGIDSVCSRVSVHVEETLEMIGVAVFIYALLNHLARHVGEFRVSIVGGARRACPVCKGDDFEQAASAGYDGIPVTVGPDALIGSHT